MKKKMTQLDGSVVEVILSEADKQALYLQNATDHEESCSTIERYWRNNELNRADVEIEKSLDAGNATLAQSFRTYRVELRAYPEGLDFPFGTRPTAPDGGNS